jgi:hypothetical protein
MNVEYLSPQQLLRQIGNHAFSLSRMWKKASLSIDSFPVDWYKGGNTRPLDIIRRGGFYGKSANFGINPHDRGVCTYGESGWGYRLGQVKFSIKVFVRSNGCRDQRTNIAQHFLTPSRCYQGLVASPFDAGETSQPFPTLGHPCDIPRFANPIRTAPTSY